MTRPLTYETFVLHTIMPAPGWQVVYYDDHGQHLCAPVDALALVIRRVRACQSSALVDPYDGGTPDEELRAVVGCATARKMGCTSARTPATLAASCGPETRWRPLRCRRTAPIPRRRCDDHTGLEVAPGGARRGLLPTACADQAGCALMARHLPSLHYV
jgi:hypothetical protein